MTGGVTSRYANPSYVADEKVVAESREKILKVLKIYNDILGKQKYIGGDMFTIADVFHVPYFGLLTKVGELEKLYEGLPNVERWCKEICERESVKKALGG
jgi:glutathione S-transferase